MTKGSLSLEEDIAKVEGSLFTMFPNTEAHVRRGGVAEWLNASLSKSEIPDYSGIGGSNPSPSAKEESCLPAKGMAPSVLSSGK